MKILLLGHARCPAERLRELEAIADVHWIPPVNDDEAPKALRRMVEANGPFDVFAGLFLPQQAYPFRWSRDLLEPLFPHCRLVIQCMIGYDNVDRRLIADHGAVFCNVRHTIATGLAEGVFVALLASCRRIRTFDAITRQGKWRDNITIPRHWSELTLGIIGLGNVGSQVATKAAAVGFGKVIYHNRKPKAGAPFEYVATSEELCRRSDVIIPMVPLTDQTRHLIDAVMMEKMKDGVVIINAGRGSVINEADLVEMLHRGKVAHAALDVYENEPHIHPGLIDNINTTLTPHCLPATTQTFGMMHAEMLDNIIDYVKGGRARDVVPFEE